MATIIARVPAPGDTFATFQELHVHMKDLSVKHGFVCSRNTKTFHPQSARELFGTAKAVQRGFFYCAHKNDKNKNNQNVKTTCKWRVPFTFDREKRLFYIKEELYEVIHNHPLGHSAVDEAATPRAAAPPINREKLLYQTEIDQIAQLAREHVAPHHARQVMQDNHPGREYTMELIRRLIRSHQTPTASQAATVAGPPVVLNPSADEEQRYVALHQQFNKILAHVVHDPHMCRLFTLNLVAFEQSLPAATSINLATTVAPPALVPEPSQPPRQRGKRKARPEPSSHDLAKHPKITYVVATDVEPTRKAQPRW
ncbi:Aste57867_12033 [Aphanomyces stellatus]|uniref:Aste57867_12033 protein n=1 Tax=Aphanomyces stellatus TaxID=120398 RepID=A0A485KV38_9STRA|nr:hypothetical protein As57867_011988 [Aphanomyces stellatus]VFT88888.1 Aste57867_12033 [Aphanomyces stellatus]